MDSIDGEIKAINPDSMGFDDKEAIKTLVVNLLNIIEKQGKAIEELRKENQSLKDEINRLKGEKGMPNIKPNVPRKENDVFVPPPKSSKNEWKKGSKKQRVKIDRVEYVRVDRSTLPPDAEHKGYRPVVKQNIKFETDNVEYRLERYYSRGEGRTYEAELPDGVNKNGEFEAGLTGFVTNLYFACRVPEKKIWKVLAEAGIIISEGQISNILTKINKEEFTREKEDIFEAGMKCADHFHIDDAGARHRGVNHHVQVVCTALFSVFFITRKKNRDTIMELLGLGKDEKIDKVMMSDDARQFWDVAVAHALCWIHEIRHYRKLNPLLNYHRLKLRSFLTEIWEFYEHLKEYKKDPTEERKEFLEQRFNELFSTKTGYQELDERIALTREKREKLLLVLDHPEIPLHNNPAEIALREFVIKKKVSYGTRSEDGRIAWENMMTLLDTCRKLDVSFYDYLKDRFSGKCVMPNLATIISQRASTNSTVY